VQHTSAAFRGRCNWFQSSPVPKDGCNWEAQPIEQWQNVSILTRPEGRVQRGLGGVSPPDRLFQSSPVPKDGCNPWFPLIEPSTISFQSSPVPKDGCNRVKPKTMGGWRSRFNPHPSRRTGATHLR